ncbi:hypothetical protein FA15DRAFT_708581 [Coprinopsis marcescibilis]|uniref:SnoaL-like domain-containing protein n=1 Tax=Coprinopsis marcescibilis TaxID=230819 RepID=A0A5C3KJ47_COPMA|nr:hypothetical protein FA15DRAFT_708581 [Coprinopsis marcescibilis]
MRLEYLQTGAISSTLSPGDAEKVRGLVEKGALALEQGDASTMLDLYTDDAIAHAPGLPSTQPTRQSKQQFYAWLMNASNGMNFILQDLQVDDKRVIVKYQTEFTLQGGSVHKGDFILTADTVKVGDGYKFSSSRLSGDLSALLPLWVKSSGPIPAQW